MSAPQLRAYRVADPTTCIGVVAYRSLQWNDPLNDFGAAKVEFVGDGPTWDDSGTDVRIWEADTILSVAVDGAVVFSFLVEAMTVEWPTIGRPDLAVRTVTGRGVGAMLGDATTYGVVRADGTTYEINLRHVGRTRAAILSDLLDAAHARDAAELIVRDTWGDTADTDAQSWTDADTVVVQAGTSLDRLVSDWGDYGWDWHVAPLDAGTCALGLWKRKGADLSGTVRLFAAPDLNAIDEEIDLRGITNVIVGDAGANDTSSPPTIVERTATPGRRRRKELWQSFRGVATDISTIADDTLATSKDPVAERRITLRADPSVTPGSDFTLGDTVSVQSGAGTLVPMRVLAIGGESDGSTTQWTVTCDGILAHRRRRWINELEQAGPTPPGGGGEPVDQTYIDTIFDFEMAITIGPVEVTGAPLIDGAPQGVTAFGDPGVINVMPPGSGFISDDFSNGVEGVFIPMYCPDLGDSPDPSAAGLGTTTPTQYHFVATGSPTGGSYDVTRGAIATVLFTVNRGDVEADIQAAALAWFGNTGYGTIAGDWDDWTWELPGAYTQLQLGADASGLTGGTSPGVTVTRPVAGVSAHGLGMQFNCGFSIGLGTATTPLDGLKASDDGTLSTTKKFSARDRAHFGTDEDDLWAAYWSSGTNPGGITKVKARPGDTGLSEDRIVLTANNADDVAEIALVSPDANSGSGGSGFVQVDPADPDKLKITNPDGTTFGGGGDVQEIVFSWDGPVATHSTPYWNVPFDMEVVWIKAHCVVVPAADFDIDVYGYHTITISAGDDYQRDNFSPGDLEFDEEDWLQLSWGDDAALEGLVVQIGYRRR